MDLAYAEIAPNNSDALDYSSWLAEANGSNNPSSFLEYKDYLAKFVPGSAEFLEVADSSGSLIDSTMEGEVFSCYNNCHSACHGSRGWR